MAAGGGVAVAAVAVAVGEDLGGEDELLREGRERSTVVVGGVGVGFVGLRSRTLCGERALAVLGDAVLLRCDSSCCGPDENGVRRVVLEVDWGTRNQVKV